MKDYIYTEHATDMLKEREIKEKWIKETLKIPDTKETKADGTVHYIKKIEEYGDRFLRVIVNPKIAPQKIVTLFFDRTLRRQKK